MEKGILLSGGVSFFANREGKTFLFHIWTATTTALPLYFRVGSHRVFFTKIEMLPYLGILLWVSESEEIQRANKNIFGNK